MGLLRPLWGMVPSRVCSYKDRPCHPTLCKLLKLLFKIKPSFLFFLKKKIPSITMPNIFAYIARAFGGGKVEITMYVSAIIAGQNTILHGNSHRVWMESMSCPGERSIESVAILATVGNEPKKWYSHEEFMRYDGAMDKLRQLGPM